MELFDVVDELDRVVEQRPRGEVHAARLRHRAVHVFLVRGDGRMLIHLRTPTKEEFPSVWTSSASGHVSAGETYDESAARELTEELGIVAPLERLKKFDACPDTSMEFTVLYSAASDEPISADETEIAAIDWLETGEISRRIRDRPALFSPAFRLLFEWFDTVNRNST
ncbi:MAG: NUDIX domain-containing protein [Planctomycetaceae bacterium]